MPQKYKTTKSYELPKPQKIRRTKITNHTVILISSTPLNSVTFLRDSRYYSKLSCSDGNFSYCIRVVMSNCKERCNMYVYSLVYA